MEFGIGTYGLGYLAGVLSTLSPCVLPLIPIVLGSAVTAHRWGAMALAAGLVLSFTTVGIFIATIGASVGLSAGQSREILGAAAFQRIDADRLTGGHCFDDAPGHQPPSTSAGAKIS